MANAKSSGLSKGWIIGIVVAAVALLAVFWIVGSYNSLVKSQVAVDNQWGQVQTVYQRRADLIPNLVATVQGSANFEQETQTKIAELRTQAASIKSELASAKTPAELEAAAAKLDGVVAGYRGLNINVENYPDLKSNANFLALQDELANTENKVAVERGRFNNAVGAYNTKIRLVPTNLVAGLFGFEKREFFAAEESAQDAPSVAFE